VQTRWITDNLEAVAADGDGLGLESGTVRLVVSRAEWSRAFAEVAAPLRRALGPAAVDVAHVGSTAVPGLIAKPILDVAVGLAPGAGPADIVRALTDLGYVFRGDKGADGGLLFVWEDHPRVRTVHVHAVPHGGRLWARYLKVRDRLRADDEARERYTALKIELAQAFPDDRAAYTAGKAPFIEMICAEERADDAVHTAPTTARPWWILHVDLDQFLAAVEVRRRPELRGRPVVVGGSGDPTQPRMVVETASYEARAFGIRSGMPLRAAARRCPDAVFLPSDKPAYNAASAEVMETLRRFPVVVEVWGWDEAVVGTDTDDPEGLAASVKDAVRRDTGLSCSVGIGDNKLRAKAATGFAKPGGIYRLTEANWMEVMGHRSVQALPGVGPKTARKLAELGLGTIGELAAADVTAVRRRFGQTMGAWYVLLGRGVGSAKVTAEPWLARSRSRQRTFPQDLTDRADIERELRALARRVTSDVTADDRWIRRVAIVVRFASFYTPTRVTTLPTPTQDPDAVARAAVGLLDRVDLRRPVRLLGVRAELVPPA
jgi:DNA polymerase-4